MADSETNDLLRKLIELQTGGEDLSNIYATAYLYCNKIHQADAEIFLNRYNTRFFKHDSLIDGVTEYIFTVDQDKFQVMLGDVKELNAQLLVTRKKIDQPGSILPPNLVKFDQFYPGCNRKFQGTASDLATLSAGFVTTSDFLIVQRALDAMSTTTTVGNYSLNYGQAGNIAGNVPVNASVRDQTIYEMKMRGPIVLTQTGCSINYLWVEWDNIGAGLEQSGFLETLTADFTGTKTNIVAANDQLSLSGGGSATNYTETLSADFTGTKINAVVSSDKITLSGASTLGNNIVSHWKMDEASGSSVADSIGSNTGTATGTTITMGKINNARNYPGSTNNYISVPHNSSIDGMSAFTISAWVKVNAFSTSYGDGTMTLLAKNATPSLYATYGIDILTTASGTPGKIRVWSNQPGSSSYMDSTGAISAGSWAHIVFVVEGSGVNQQHIYINGSNDKNGSTGQLPGTGSSPLYIGMWRSTGGLYEQCFNGIIDEVGIWNRALSSTEVTNLYNSGSGMQPPFISAYNTPGSYDQVKNLAAMKAINSLSWNKTLPANTALSVDYRFSNDNVNWTTWNTGNTTSPINFTSKIYQYIDVKFNLSTTDTSVTPSLDDWTLNYSPTYAASGSYESTDKDAGALGLVFTKIKYGQTIPAGCGIAVSYKVGDLQADLANAAYETINLSIYPTDFTLPANRQKRWLKFRIDFTSNYVNSPTVQDIEGRKG